MAGIPVPMSRAAWTIRTGEGGNASSRQVPNLDLPSGKSYKDQQTELWPINLSMRLVIIFSAGAQNNLSTLAAAREPQLRPTRPEAITPRLN